MDIYQQFNLACEQNDLSNVKILLAQFREPTIQTRLFKKIAAPFVKLKQNILTNYKIGYPIALALAVITPNRDYTHEQKIDQAFYSACWHGSVEVIDYLMSDKKFLSLCDPIKTIEAFMKTLVQEAWSFDEAYQNTLVFVFKNHDFSLPQFILKSNNKMALTIKLLEQQVRNYEKLDTQLSLKETSPSTRRNKL